MIKTRLPADPCRHCAGAWPSLARKGAIEMIPGTSRGIRLPEEEGLPIVGLVAAGSPILAQEHIEDHCRIPASFFRPQADYLLTVHGDSMIESGILDGDLIALHRSRFTSRVVCD